MKIPDTLCKDGHIIENIDIYINVATITNVQTLCYTHILSENVTTLLSLSQMCFCHQLKT